MDLVRMTRDDRTGLYLIMAHLGALAAVGVLVSFGFDLPDFVKGLTIGIMVAPLAVMLIRGLRDEYIEQLWQAGTSWAFVAIVFGYLVLPAAEGFYDGFTANAGGRDIPAEAAGFAAIVAFYTGFHVRWLRGLR